MNAGFILLYRQITEWEWYQNPNTFRVFLHVLLKANFTDGRFEGREVKRGQLITSLPKLSVQTKLTIQQVRTALKHLVSTGEITDEGNSQYRIITIVKYDDYQRDNRQNNSQSTDDQQTNNRRSTDNQQQYKKDNNEIKEQWNNDNDALMDDAEAHAIQHEHDQIIEAATSAGFKCTDSEIAELLRLYADHGLEKMLFGIKSCVDHSAPNLAYLKAVLKGEPKKTPAIKMLPSQQYSQRDYSGEQDEAMERMLKLVKDG